MAGHSRRVRIGSRASRLAVIQAELVIAAIKAFDPEIETELVTMKTTGDLVLDKSLDAIGGKGLFVKELDRALLDGLVDITVHSYKDLPMYIDPLIPIVAFSQREDPRDVLVLPRHGADASKPVGCSSARRKLQLSALMKGVKVSPVRGNVPTRIEKLDGGEYSALVLAAAGIKRLGLEERISRYFSTEEILPAACQGIIAVEARRGEDTGYLKLFDSPSSRVVSAAERSFVEALDGGCSSPVAAYARVVGGSVVLEGLYVDGFSHTKKGTVEGPAKDAERLGRELAKKLSEKNGEGER